MTRRPCTPPKRRGTVLIVAMVITFALAAMTITLCRSMATEALAAANGAAAVQAAAVARGAEQYVIGILSDTTAVVTTLPEETFANVPVGDGYFWIVRPDYADDALPAYGLVEETAKVDINSAGYESLMMLPGMTEDLAGAIVDWRDEDDTPTGNGAESQHYLSLSDPYGCKNAPFETVEELLLVKGFTPQLLYGDAAGPGTSGATGATGTTGRTAMTGAASTGAPTVGSGSSTYGDPILANGIFDLLTVHSVAPAPSVGGGQGGGAGSGQVQLPVRGRINVNTAPREVLLCIEGLDQSDVDKLLAARPSGAGDGSGSIDWIDAPLGPKAQETRRRVTGQTLRYSADIVAVSGNGRAFKRVRVVFDISESTPRVLYRRDLTDRGWPMDPQILASLRAGQGLGAWGVGMSLSSSAEGMLR